MTLLHSESMFPNDDLVPLEAILRTEELQRRPSRAPDYETENRALSALVQALADSPGTILQSLADTILDVCRADSSGMSLVTKDNKRFEWAAIAGAWKPHLGGGTPRDFGPCGDVLDHNVPLLFTHWERRYPYLADAMPLAEEGLLIPFYVEGKAVGTIWAIMHGHERKFDAEDLRLLQSLGRFASAAYQAVHLRRAEEERRAAFKAMQEAVQARQAVDRLNAQLSASEQRLNDLIAALPAAVYTTDAQGRITFYNQAAADLAGREPRIGQDEWCVTWKLYWPDGRPLPHDECPMAVALKENRPVRGAEAIAERPDGTRVPFIPYPTPLRDTAGNLVGGVNMLVDITERKKAETALRESEARLLAELNATRQLQALSMEFIHEGGSAQEIYQKVVDAAVSVMRSDFGSMQLFHPDRGEKGELQLLAFHGFDPEAAKFWTWVRADSGCTCGQALRTGRRAIATNVETCDFMAGTPDRTAYLQAGMYAAQSTPLVSRSGHLLGMISTHWCAPHEPPENDLRRLDLLARQAADLIERTEAEEKLRRSEAESQRQRRLYEGILANTPDLAYIFDLDHRFIYANEILLKMWGKSWDEAIGKTCLELGYEPWHAAMHDREIEQVIATKQPIRGEVPFTGTFGRRIYDYIFVPVIGPNGEVEAVAGTTRDITERQQQEQALRDAEERFRAFVLASSDVVYRMSADWSEMRHLTGKDFIADTLEPSSAWLGRYIHPDDQAQVVAAIKEAIRTKSVFELEHRVLRVDGTLGWTLSRAIPILDGNGDIVEWFGAASDITTRKQHEERQQLLLNELNHRVKNTLATVQSIAMQTLRNSRDTEQARGQIEARLIALSKAHDILTRENWTGASLRQVIDEAVTPYCGERRERFDVKGPDVWISPKYALALAMALHEFCTNAVKYGALSNDAGRVRITWTVVGNRGIRTLAIQWREVDGPPVAPPSRRGFGSRLIERGLKQDLGGQVRIEFAPSGVTCTIEAPLDEADEADGTGRSGPELQNHGADARP